MKIIFLGTSHGVQAVDRYCQSMLIETAQGSYIIDAGAPVMDCLIRLSYDLKKIKGVFITHLHSDHTDGLLGLISLANWYYKEMKFDVFLPEQGGIEGVGAYLSAVFKNSPNYPNDRIHMHLVEEGVIYEHNGMKITAFPTGHMEHYNRPAYGYLLEAEGKKLYISGDLNGGRIDYPEFLNTEPVDTFVVECAHFSAESLVEKLRNCKAKYVMPVHVWTLDKYDTIKNHAEEFSFRLEYPVDGDCFEI